MESTSLLDDHRIFDAAASSLRSSADFSWIGGFGSVRSSLEFPPPPPQQQHESSPFTSPVRKLSVV
jgi:hypothetical protein